MGQGFESLKVHHTSGCGADGSARGVGPWGRRFDPCHPDHYAGVDVYKRQAIDDIRTRELLGYTVKFPKWAIAYKFEAQEATTKLLDVEWNVGRSGRVSPTAILELSLIHILAPFLFIAYCWNAT